MVILIMPLNLKGLIKLNKQIIKRALVLFIATILIVMGIRALLIFWFREKDISEIRTDREGLEMYFPNFPETESLYWMSAVEKRSVGHVRTELYIFAKLDDAEFAHFIEGASYSEVTRLPLFFQPKQIKGPFHWQELEDTGQLDSSIGRTIYIDLQQSLVFIEASGTAN
ncbi:hypothetical protein [Enterococcus larvae]|uniref:hypothetical protein n=1 Tax=Enterococcus larvae TaxID=2794352 RepID=UPI003F2D949C